MPSLNLVGNYHKFKFKGTFFALNDNPKDSFFFQLKSFQLKKKKGGAYDGLGILKAG
jgi:hypothetical protein